MKITKTQLRATIKEVIEEGTDFELYAKGLDRVSKQCETISGVS